MPGVVHSQWDWVAVRAGSQGEAGHVGARGAGEVWLRGATSGHAPDLGFYLKCSGKPCIKGGCAISYHFFLQKGVNIVSLVKSRYASLYKKEK